MGVLASLKWLRGGSLDVFGYSDERRAERAWIERFEQTVEELSGQLTQRNLDAAVRVAQTPQQIRGYGPVKAASQAQAERAFEQAVKAFRVASPRRTYARR